MIPIFITQAVILFQDTSLVFVVSLHDFLTATTIIANRDGTADRSLCGLLVSSIT